MAKLAYESSKLAWDDYTIGEKLPAELLMTLWESSFDEQAQLGHLFSLVHHFRGVGRFLPVMDAKIVGDFIVDELNRQGIQLLDQEEVVIQEWVEVLAYEVEIDGTAGAEWLVEVQDQKLDDWIWISLDQSPDGRYRLLETSPHAFFGFSGVENPDGRFQDLNGDGIQDAVIIQDAFQTGDSVLFIHMLAGSPEGFLGFSNDRAGASTNYMIYNYAWEWIRSSTTWRPAIRVTQFEQSDWGCDMYSVTDHEWHGDETVVIERGHTNEQTVECLIAEAVDAHWQPPDRARQIKLLGQALQMGPESAEIRTFLNFRLALLYLLEGNDASARGHADELISIGAAGEFELAGLLAAGIQPLLENSVVCAFEFCQVASVLGIDPSPDEFNLFGRSFGYQGHLEGFSSPLCRDGRVLEEVLLEVELSSAQPIEQSLAAHGLEARVSFLITTPQPEPVWLIGFLLDNVFSSQYIRLYRFSASEGWRNVDSISLNSGSLEFGESDLTDDGFPEIIMLAPASNPDTADCSGTTIPYNILITTRLPNGWIYSDELDRQCLTAQQSKDISSYLSDADRDGWEDHLAQKLIAENYDLDLLSVFEGEPRWLLGWYSFGEPRLDEFIQPSSVLRRLTSRLIADPANPELPGAIELYIDYWQADPNITVHLTYLLAYSHEARGNETEAVRLYFEIWRDYPETLWAHLAASRVALKP